MAFLKKAYEDLWKSIIRPPRERYEMNQLGPQQFILRGLNYHRTDLELVNDRGLKLQCSHFEPVDAQRPREDLPCVIYLHANCSSRVESLNALPILLPCGITVFSFDFSGCGRSDGEYISLGWFERDDLACVIDHLRKTDRVSCIGLWGRSMGAVTALMHGFRDPSIAGMVLDCPFSSLYVLANDLAKTYTSVPNFVLSTVMKFVRSTVQKNAHFDIENLKPIDNVGSSFIPALFGVAMQDSFIHPSHSEELFSRYGGEKHLFRFDGDHNSLRPTSFLDTVGIFFYNALQCEQLPEQIPLPDDEEEQVRKALELSLRDSAAP